MSVVGKGQLQDALDSQLKELAIPFKHINDLTSAAGLHQIGKKLEGLYYITFTGILSYATGVSIHLTVK